MTKKSLSCRFYNPAIFGLMISNGISLLLGQSPKSIPWIFIQHQRFFTFLERERGLQIGYKTLVKAMHSHLRKMLTKISRKKEMLTHSSTAAGQARRLKDPLNNYQSLLHRAWLCPAVPASSLPHYFSLSTLCFLISCFFLIPDLCT